MTIANCINALLYRHDCVIIPGFGAILTHKISAKIHQTTNTFYPPKKVLAFNAQLHQNDGLLANYVAKSESCSYTDASRMISVFVFNVNEIITTEGKYSLNQIGDFIKNEDGKLVFKPNNLNNFLTASFGLSHYFCEPIQRELIQTSKTKVIPITKSSRVSSVKPYLKYASIGLIALLIGGIPGSKLYLNHIESENQIAHEEASDAIDRKIQEATFVLSSPIPSATLKVEVSKASRPFHLIAGAFKNAQNASNKVNQLHQNGYNNARSLGLNRYGLHQIAYDSFGTREEALNALYAIRKSDNESAWLFVDFSK